MSNLNAAAHKNSKNEQKQSYLALQKYHISNPQQTNLIKYCEDYFVPDKISFDIFLV